MATRRQPGIADAGIRVPERSAPDAGHLSREGCIPTARYDLLTTPLIHHLLQQEPPSPAIVRQFLPAREELWVQPGEHDDPTADLAHSPVPGLVHRYPDRVLLLLTGRCMVHCRFCFRKHRRSDIPDADDSRLASWHDYISRHGGIREAILSGGDPLVLDDDRLETILSLLHSIPQLHTLRIHTRVPTVLPSRITARLTAILARHRPLWLVLHVNHAQEIGSAAQLACQRLSRAGIPLLAQSVLLRGVNDDLETLIALYRRLTEWSIKPYYLHHCDPAPGTEHFRIPLCRGAELVHALRGRLPGYALPVYVMELPGGYGKIPVERPWLQQQKDGSWLARSPLHPKKRIRIEDW